MNKLKINKIDKEVHSFKGFDHKGCHGCDCDDECCKNQPDIDKECYELILKNSKFIEKELGMSIKECFEGYWYDENDFLGGNVTEPVLDKDGFCIFHSKKGKGCVLFNLVKKNNLPRRIIPSICRLYPLTWGGDELMISDDLYPTCNCINGRSKANILETQKREIEDIFDTKEIKGKMTS